MRHDEILKLIRLMEDNDLVELEIEEKGKKIKLRKREGGVIRQTPEITQKTEPITGRQEQVKEEGSVHVINSPLVGTFYEAPSPGAEPFVKIGSKVKVGDVLCIIEAMKVMNEIKSDVNGTIKEILAQNSQLVEYDQPLFKIALQ